ncbi:hypothetical protein [Ruminococcus sp. Marseille-P6503]|uniref:hypothetical protein n=1 Tax=Ruminococcus sp. Marseille-P6503 TaxID=2364796 RepID=UPI000F52B0C9|nr:hypothetical protein [Ruminococcus sp. Marseille-P6503]
MKRLYESYRQTADELAAHIRRLKEERLSRRDPDELNRLNARIELLETERAELIRVCAQLRAYTEPKPASPSMAARIAKAGA